MANSPLTQPSPRMTSRSLAEVIRAGIDSGEFPTGDLLPSYRELGETHGVAVNTVQAAVRLLEQSGRVRIRKGKGAEVLPADAGASPAAQLAEVGQDLADALDEFRELGVRQAALEKRLGRLLDRVHQVERAQSSAS